MMEQREAPPKGLELAVRLLKNDGEVLVYDYRGNLGMLESMFSEVGLIMEAYSYTTPRIIKAGLIGSSAKRIEV